MNYEEQKNDIKTEAETQTSKENLEHKTKFFERMKYAGPLAAITIGSYFVPELKKKYNSLSEKNRETYRTIMLASTTLAGVSLTAYSGYQLFRDYQTKKLAEKKE